MLFSFCSFSSCGPPLAAHKPGARIWPPYGSARDAGGYAFRADITQRQIPLATVANVGRSSRADSFYIEGDTDPVAGAMTLTLWSEGGSVLDAESGITVHVDGDQVQARRGQDGEWQTLESFGDVFAPEGDFMSYLVAARDVQREAGDDGRLRYTFTVDGPRFAAYLRDQLRAQMAEITTPTLILHGRHDFLTPAWGAELHHRLMPASRLVMLDASHFMPVSDPELVAAHLLPFLDRHDDPATPAIPGLADFAPLTAEQASRSRLGALEFMHGTHWALLVLLIMLGTFLSEDATVIGVGILIAAGSVDAGVGFLGCFLGIAAGDIALWSIGRFVGRRALHWPLVRDWLPEKAIDRWGRAFDRHAVKAVFVARAIPGTRIPTYIAAGILSRRAHRFVLWAVLAAVVWTPVLLIVSAFVGPQLLKIFHLFFEGPVALIAALAVLFVAIRTVVLATTKMGRIRLAVALRRPARPEFWPPWFFYIPLAPWVLWLALRHRGPMSFTCLNPSIPHGGGVVGESKHQMMKALEAGGASPWLGATELIEAGLSPEERAERVDTLTVADPAYGGYPVVLKPDASQRGHAFKVARSKRDVLLYFQDMTRPALLQRYHPGPEEAGVLWARRPGAAPDEPGFIFSVTRKVFPVIEGDGARTLEELIWAHPRFRMQAEIFLKRFVDQTDRILFKGEKLRLAVAGNHARSGARTGSGSATGGGRRSRRAASPRRPALTTRRTAGSGDGVLEPDVVRAAPRP